MSSNKSGESLPVMEAFYTIQGEGFHSGRSAYFIRLGGCDVGCHWCDVKDSWEAEKHPNCSIESIVAEATQYPSRFVVITGGEPAMYDLTPLTYLLKEKGFEIAIETSGVYPLNGLVDWVCVSPKKFKPVLPEMLKLANELKVIINHTSDYQFAEQFLRGVPSDCKLYLQAEYSKFDHHIEGMIDYVKANPSWKISLQTHKIINVP
ncbi:MAG: 7-carboxy-7-deazaguanine synthase QueE [Bacteroidia bacterium]